MLSDAIGYGSQLVWHTLPFQRDYKLSVTKLQSREWNSSPSKVTTRSYRLNFWSFISLRFSRLSNTQILGLQTILYTSIPQIDYRFTLTIVSALTMHELLEQAIIRLVSFVKELDYTSYYNP